MKLVYIAGPYTAPTPWELEQNIRRAEMASLAVSQIGLIPVCPHTQLRYFFGQGDERFWLAGTMELMRRCDAVLLIDGWRTSKGTLAEVEEAAQLNMITFASFDELQRYAAHKWAAEIW